MRVLSILLWAACVLGGTSTQASAQQSCVGGGIGVSRVAEIDSKGGPWFGSPHDHSDLLSAGEVVLTFDDGPLPKYTRPILAALAEQCVKATFFVVGEMAAEYPDVVREISAQGHTIGAHSWSHANLRRLSAERAKVEIDAAFTAIEKAAGRPIAPFFRFPYLSESSAADAYLRSRNMALFGIDIDSEDWRTEDPKRVIANVFAGLRHRGKGMILFHDVHESTARAIPELLPLLKARGFRIVHLRPKWSYAEAMSF